MLTWIYQVLFTNLGYKLQSFEVGRSVFTLLVLEGLLC